MTIIADYSKPENLLVVSDRFQGNTSEAIETALTRAEAILLLLSCQFDEENNQTLSAEWIGNSICAVRGELGIVRSLIRPQEK